MTDRNFRSLCLALATLTVLALPLGGYYAGSTIQKSKGALQLQEVQAALDKEVLRQQHETEKQESQYAQLEEITGARIADLNVQLARMLHQDRVYPGTDNGNAGELDAASLNWRSAYRVCAEGVGEIARSAAPGLDLLRTFQDRYAGQP